MQIIGQTDIVKLLDTYVVSRLHKPILMVGSQGCGKHFFTAYLAEKLGVEVEDITDTISAETIDEICAFSLPKLFVFNISKVAMIKKLNIMLKFLEEPSIHYIVLLADSYQQVSLPTIKNRCLALNFKPYTNSDLLEITKLYNIDTKFIKYCKTPGKLVTIDLVGFEKMVKLVDRIILEGLKGVNLIKFLKVKDRFNLDNNPKDKIDVQSFFNYMVSDIFTFTFKEEWLKNCYLECVKITSKYNSLIIDSRLNLDMLLSNYLIDIWGVYNQ